MKFQSSDLFISDFNKMNLPANLLESLKKLKLHKPTPIQSLAIPVGMEGHDLVAIAKTGSGKTLAYALTALSYLNKKPEARALILTPSREVATQVHKVMKDLSHELAVDAVLIIGGKGTGTRQSNQLKQKPRVVIATPGRLNDLLITNKLLLQGVEVIVVDEADRMLDIGFAPQLLNIRKTMRGRIQVMMFSASFHQQVETIAKAFLQPNAYMIRTRDAEAPVSELQQTLLYGQPEQKWKHILDLLNSTKGGVFIFTNSQENCEKLGEYLESYGYSSEYVHGGMTQGHRNKTLRAFREGELRILVSTDMLARGLDVPHVDHVINFDLPIQTEEYLHRIGRTARAGKSGNAWTYITSKDGRLFEKIKPYIHRAKEVKIDPNFHFEERAPRRIDKMAAMQGRKPQTAAQFSELKNRKMKDAPKAAPTKKFGKPTQTGKKGLGKRK